MNYTKKELEAIWRDKPIGWLLQEQRKAKKLKRFSVRVSVSKVEELDPLTITLEAGHKKEIDIRNKQIVNALEAHINEQGYDFKSETFSYRLSITQI
jgi:hypothetical protein